MEWGGGGGGGIFSYIPGPRIHCKLDPVQYREYEYGLVFSLGQNLAPDLTLKLLGFHHKSDWLLETEEVDSTACSYGSQKALHG